VSSFRDKARPPSPPELAAELGRSYDRWVELKGLLVAEFGPLAEAWKFSGAKYGWALQLKRKSRAVLYLVPERRHLRAAFALGKRAVDAARASDLPPAVIEVIDNGQQFAEGRAVRLDVRTKRDLAPVVQLAIIKMA
jgi:hypothetical protein